MIVMRIMWDVYMGFNCAVSSEAMNVNEGNSLVYFDCIKYFRLHRQLEALQQPSGLSARI